MKLSRRHALRLAALLAFAAYFSWRPCKPDLLFRAIPDDAFVATHHRNVSSEWHALARHPMLLNALKAAGVEDAEELADETGFQQTLFWLTGPRTVLGLSTIDGSGPLSLLDAADENEALSRLRLSGASYVGWKRRPMEWLRRICYVPGLGRLHRTELGTRYLIFKHGILSKRLGMVLSLDMVDGNLLAVLSTNPDAVTGLVARVRSGDGPALVFPDEPWQCPDRAMRNTIYLRPGDESQALRIDMPSFRDKTQLAFRAALPGAGEQQAYDSKPDGLQQAYDSEKGAPPPAIGPLPDGAELARVAISGDLLTNLLPELRDASPGAPPPSGALLVLYGQPYGSTLCGFSLPGLFAAATPDGLRTEAWLSDLLAASSDNPKKRAVLMEPADGIRRVNLRPLFPKHFRPHSDESPFLIPPTAAGTPLVVGSCLASYSALAAAGIPAATAPLPSTAPALDASIDLPRTAAELGSLVAVLRLAAPFVSGLADIRPALDGATRALATAATLGTLRIRLDDPAPGSAESHLTASFQTNPIDNPR